MPLLIKHMQGRLDLTQAVSRILASEAFKKSPAAVKLLSYLLSETLAGEVKITPYHVAHAVLDIEEGFDAHSNAIVRVQCSRLRKLLTDYYDTEGLHDPWRVGMPPGRYALVLEEGQTDHSRFGSAIAVLPLQSPAGHGELADGMTREIIYALTQCRELRLMAPDTVFQFRDRVTEPVAVGKSLGVDYVLDGALDDTSGALRVGLKLTDVQVGQVMWSNRYDHDLSVESVDQILADTARQITAVLVGPGGTIDRLSRGKPQLFSAYAAVLKFYQYLETYSPEAHQSAREALEQAVQDAPEYAEAWACLAGIYCNEYMFGFNPAAHGLAPLDRALDAAKRSVQLAPDCVMGQYGLAQTYYYRREFELFRAAATRALALAPYRTDMQASLGLHFAYDGQWKKGLQMIDLARKLNPLHPGWYWFPFVADAYRRKDFAQALVVASRLNMPDFFWEPLFVAMIEGQLGHRDKASAALRRAVELNPELTSAAREIIAKIFPDEALVDRFMEGLAKAGLGAD